MVQYLILSILNNDFPNEQCQELLETPIIGSPKVSDSDEFQIWMTNSLMSVVMKL
jgi:hypothetical protein